MKKTSLFSLLILLFGLKDFIFAAQLPAIPQKVEQYTLENGMQVFLLEDFSSPLVRVEFSTRAGFSNQTQTTNGFFKLYSRILQASFPAAFFDEVQCNSDSSRYLFTTTTSQVEAKLSALSDQIFSTSFSDEVLTAELNQLKAEVQETENSAASLINAAIDSKVFSSAPWQHDSGIYPPLFKRTTEKNARTILSEIGQKYYTPQNSALFVSGNFNSEKMLAIIKNQFGKYYSTWNPVQQKNGPELNKQKKFVIHDKDFSSELTQVVVQYTLLNMEQADLLAAALNNNNSTFKNSVLAAEELNIPGDEYINAASAHKKDNSRLIFQTLLQPPEDKKSKITSASQTEIFTDKILSLTDQLQTLEIISAKNQLMYQLNGICATSTDFMDNLANFWAISPYENQSPLLLAADFPECQSPLVNQLLLHFQKINSTEKEDLVNQLKSESPFVFVIISDEDFAKTKKEYAALGYQEITSKNSSWYVQEMYKNIRDQFKPDEENLFNSSSQTLDNNYFERNISQIKKTQLSNGINITYKQNPQSTSTVLLINIKGGKLNSASDNGFEEVMVNILASMIQRELYAQQASGIILGNTSVTSSSQNYTSSILIECDSDDFIAVCNSAAKAIIYGEVMPAWADRAVNSRQYKKRLENGSASNQLYEAAIKTLYGSSDFSKIYEYKNDILESTNYTKILAAIPDFLEANRYSLIVTGSFSEASLTSLESGFGQLGNNKKVQNTPQSLILNLPKNKSQNVKITHTFLTDIPAEKAGPQPAVLIPTTDFLDPVMYFIKAPEFKDEEDLQSAKQEAVFKAALNYLGFLLQKNIASNKRINSAKVQLGFPKTDMPLGQITILNVAHTKEADSEYSKAVQELNSLLSSSRNVDTILQIKNYWTQNELSSSSTSSGTAELIQKGYEKFPENPQGDYYLTEYNYIQTATVEDFQKIMEYFPTRPPFRLYSSDGKL